MDGHVCPPGTVGIRQITGLRLAIWFLFLCHGHSLVSALGFWLAPLSLSYDQDECPPYNVQGEGVTYAA